MPDGRKEDGAVLVEFALVLFPLLLMLLGMLQFGIMLNAKIDQTHLASSGARYAAVNQNPGASDATLPAPTLQEYIKAQGDTGDLRANAEVCVDYPPNAESGTSGLPGDPVKVAMSYTYDLLPLIGDNFSTPLSTVTIEGNATMRLEAVPDEIPEGCST